MQPYIKASKSTVNHCIIDYQTGNKGKSLSLKNVLDKAVKIIHLLNSPCQLNTPCDDKMRK